MLSSNHEGETQMKIRQEEASCTKNFALQMISKPQNEENSHNQQYEDIKILIYKNQNTVKNRKEKDAEFIDSLQKLAKISRNKLNPLKMTEVLDYTKCQLIALFAQKHRDAVMPCHYDLMKIQDLNEEELQQYNENKCTCGCQKIKGNLIDFSIQQKKLDFMGSGIILYFLFIKMLVVTAAIGVLIFSIFSIIANLTSKMANNEICNSSQYCLFKVDSSLQNSKNSLLFIQISNWLGLAMCILWIIVFRITKYKSAILDFSVDKQLNTPSDTALKIQNLPYGESDQDQIAQILNNVWKNRKLDINEKFSELQIKSIQIVYNMTRIRKLIQEIRFSSISLYQKLRWSKPEYKGDLKVSDQDYLFSKKKLIDSIELLEDLKKKFYIQSSYRRKIATTCALIEFKTEKSKDQFLKRFGTQHKGLIAYGWERIKSSLYQCLKLNCLKSENNNIYFKGNILSIQRAPEPQDLLWQNCEMEYSYLKVFLIYLTSFVIILISLSILIGLNYLQVNIQLILDNQKQSILISYSISLILMIINEIILYTLAFLIHFENNHTSSDQILSMINKTVITQSLNSIIVPLISNYVIQNKFFGPDGVAGKIFDFSITNTLIFVALCYLDPMYYAKIIAIKIKWTRNKIIRYYAGKIADAENIGYIKEVNKFFEGPDINMTSSYIYLTGVIFHCSFYCLLEPFVMIMGLIGFILFYYIKKYLLLKRYSYPKMVKKIVFDKVLQNILIAPLLHGVGSFIFLEIMYRFTLRLMLPTFIVMFIAFLNILNPNQIFDVMTQKIFYFLEKKTLAPFEPKSVNVEQKQFKYNVQYYFNNNISTLFGAKLILTGLDINKQVREEIRKFIEKFGRAVYDPYEYPDESDSKLTVKQNTNTRIIKSSRQEKTEQRKIEN